MGAWGFGSFENDDAMDFMDELSESDSISVVMSALDDALSADYLEMPEASAAIVAAEVLAAKNLRPALDLPEDLAAWAQRTHVRLSETILNKAQRVVSRIATDSELNDEWSESDASDQWQAVLSDLRERLDAN
ncbi:MAG: DUF4259 domain-containing protein [Pseudomonadota bacterium]